ncbi:hypothetical protein TNCV_3535221 [Trichonephila clavipes]|nr:hypothetical protein TNCV_3535221 [Trichonephila clavipes]
MESILYEKLKMLIRAKSSIFEELYPYVAGEFGKAISRYDDLRLKNKAIICVHFLMFKGSPQMLHSNAKMDVLKLDIFGKRNAKRSSIPY